MSGSVPVPVDLDVLAGVLARQDGLRVLRRLRPIGRRLSGGLPDGAVSGLAVALAASGPDPRRHEVLALSVQSFVLDRDGCVVDAGPVREWFERPQEPVPPRSLAAAGIVAERLVGRSIPDGEASCLALTSDFVVSLRATVERPFFEARLPLAAGRPWACAVADVDWSGLGLADISFSSLLGGVGLYAAGCSPAERVAAIPHVLDRPMPGGGTAAARMIAAASRPTWIVEAPDAPGSAEEVLIDRGYAWDRTRRLWSVAVRDGMVGDEDAWASMMLYGGRRRPTVRRVTWVERYATPL